MHSTRFTFTAFGALSLGALAIAGCGELPPGEATDSELTSRQSALAIAGGSLPTSGATSAPITLPPPLQTPPPSVPLGYTATVLPFTPGGINDSGVIGGAQVGNIISFANGVTTVYPLPADLPSAVATGGAINNAGSIIGQAGTRAFVWLRPLPPGCTAPACTLPTEILPPDQDPIDPLAINNDNVVVGVFLVPPSPHPLSFEPQWHAFQWSPSGGFMDITPPDWMYAGALDVNDAGEIVGFGSPDGEAQYALRWSAVAGRPKRAILPMGIATAIANSGHLAGPGAGGAPTACTVPTTTTAAHCAALTASTPPSVPAPSDVGDLATTGRVVGDGLFGTEHPFKPWTTYAGTVTWLPVPADNGNTISDVFTNLRVNTCGSIVGSQALEFKAGNSTVFESQGFLWTKPSCDPAPPAIFNSPIGTVTATTSIGIQ